MTKERRLGRGLEALLGRPFGDEQDDISAVEGQGGAQLQLNVYEIESNPFQPRRDFDTEEIASLAESIQQHGLIQPIVVRRVSGDGGSERYQLISGERRLRAAIKAGWSDVPAQIREADDRQVAELAIVENLQRKDLNPLEKAASFQQYLQRYQCTQEELAARLSMDRSTIANLIRLLELPEGVQSAVRGGKISAGHARALLPLGDEHEQMEFARRIEAEGLSVRATEELVQESIHHSDAEPLSVVGADAPTTKRPRRKRSEHIASLEQELRAALGTKIDVKQGSRGRGKIIVHFANHDEFERIKHQLVSSGHTGLHLHIG